jgi:hypothetical protein
MSNGKEDGSIPDDCRDCCHWDQVGPRLRVRSLLTSMVNKFEQKVTASGFNPTVGDFLKVLEAEKELEWTNEGPKEIKVRWEELKPASES